MKYLILNVKNGIKELIEDEGGAAGNTLSCLPFPI